MILYPIKEEVMGDPGMTYEALLALRDHVRSRAAYDLFDDAQFLEHWVCYTCGLEPATNGRAPSGYTEGGRGVRVRSTSLSPQFVEGQYVEKLTYSDLWKDAEESRSAQEGQDIKVFVLVARFGEELRFLVIPAEKLREKRELVILIRDGDSEWLRYEARPGRLKEAIYHWASAEDEEVPQLKLFN